MWMKTFCMITYIYLFFKELLLQTLRIMMHLQCKSIYVLFHTKVSTSRAVLRAFFLYFEQSTFPFGWDLTSTTSRMLQWRNVCGRSEEKNKFLHMDLCGTCRMLDEIPAAHRVASVDVTPASLMPPSVWAPWLNLVQPGNGLLPNRYTDVSILRSERLAIPLCFALILHTVGTQYACFVVFSFLLQHHK